jgi:phage gpG-like protein
MKITVSISDTITRALAKLGDAAQKPLLMEAAGLAILSMTRRAFQEPSLRPTSWPARSSAASHALLKKSGTLWRSIAITNVTASSVSITSDRVYAAIHQFGGVIKPKQAGGSLVFSIAGKKVFAKSVTIPARPFFPVTSGGQFTEAAQKAIVSTVSLKLKSLVGQL